MTLFQSPEYNQSFSDTIDRLGDFLSSRNKVISDFLQGMPIPTDKEMDEVYKDLYRIKKRITELEAKLSMTTPDQLKHDPRIMS